MKNFKSKEFNELYKLEEQIDYIDNHRMQKVNFNEIIENKYLSGTFIEKYKDDLSDIISQYPYLTNRFVKKYKKTLNLNESIIYRNYLNEFIEENIEINHLVLQKQTLSEKKLLEEYSFDIEEKEIIRTQVLSEDYILKTKDIRRVSWNLLSEYQEMSKEFILTYKDKINFDYLSTQNLSEDIIKEFEDELDWNILVLNTDLSEEMIKKNYDKINNKQDILERQVLSEKFFENHLSDELTMSDILRTQKVSEKFLIINMDEVNWITDSTNISKNVELSDNFMNVYSNEIDWMVISEYQKLSDGFIEKHIDKIDWGLLSEYQNLSDYILDKYSVKVDWEKYSNNNELSEKDILKYEEYFTSIKNTRRMFSEEEIKEENFVFEGVKIANGKLLSESFISEYIEYVNLQSMIKTKMFSDSFIDRHVDIVGWSLVSKYQKMSKEFIEQHMNDINWYELSINKNINIDILKHFKDKLDLRFIYDNLENYETKLNLNNKIKNEKTTFLKKKKLVLKSKIYFKLYKIFNGNEKEISKDYGVESKLFLNKNEKWLRNNINILNKKYVNKSFDFIERREKREERVLFLKQKRKEKKIEIEKKRKRKEILKTIVNKSDDLTIVF